MLRGFRDFMLRGNVVDLAVAVVIGAAFGAVVGAFVKDLLTPLIAAVAGRPDFSRLQVTVNSSAILYGDFVNSVVAFLLVGAAVYVGVVLPMSRLLSRTRRAEQSDTRECPECLSRIPRRARRCAQCAAAVEPAA